MQTRQQYQSDKTKGENTGIIARLRPYVDKHVPLLGNLYRRVRDREAHRFKLTCYGFYLSGAPEMASGQYEKEEAGRFLELLESHDAVLDIGANVGFYSCLALSRGKHLIAFEPSPRNLYFLYRNLWKNEFAAAEVFPLGLASQQGLRRFFGHGGTSSFVLGWDYTDRSRYSVVPVNTLDAIAGTRLEGKRLLIKMDVEGGELDVLRGAQAVLNASPRPTWIVEIMLSDAVIPGGINSSFRETFETFWNYGYECHVLGGDELVVSHDDVLRWEARGAVSTGAHDFIFS